MGYWIDEMEPEKPQDANVVKDPNAPALYSQGAVSGFSAAFTPLFGAVLLFLNFKTLNQREGVVPVLTYGLGSTALVSYFMTLFPSAGKDSMFIFLFNGICAFAFQYYFWPKYIGKETPYRKRNTLIPFLVGIAVIAIYLVPVFLSR